MMRCSMAARCRLLLQALVLAVLAPRGEGRVGEAVVGKVRVQALSPTLVRIEPKGPKGFEDRPTFMVMNRSFPGIPVTVSKGKGGHTVRSEHYEVEVEEGGAPGACGEVQEDTDAVGVTRSDEFPEGKLVKDSDACCQACGTDPTCKAWVYTIDMGQCYTLAAFESLDKGQPKRVFGLRPQKLSFKVRDLAGKVLHDSEEEPPTPNHLLKWPAPLTQSSYALADSPRFHVPAWGAAPIPPRESVEDVLQNTNGYDFENLVDGDTYVFLLGSSLDEWTSSRAEFAALSGPVPLLPDYAYGTWFTWWHPYDEPEARSDIERWDEDKLPLDVWGLDMNWRHVSDDQDRSYNHPNTGLFPDFNEFFKYLRSKGLRTFFNDHPFPVAGRGAGGLQTSPEEIKFRWESLTSWMARGLNFWWFDPNWGISIPPPCVNSSGTAGNWMGLGNAAWGSHVYYTIVDRFRKMLGSPGSDDSRGIALSKFARDDARPGDGPKGSNRPPESPGQHRYPVWWTGDGVSLQASVESMVEAGLHDFKPFVHSDCGGDERGTGGDLLRWTAHCAFGTILRFHGADHRPWTYDGNIEEVVRLYLRTRYKLLPTLIAAGHEATRTGFPLAARCDLLWPEEEDSARNDQYIFLRDLLVAPITDSEDNVASRKVWIPPGEWQDVWSGEVVAGPKELSASQPYERQPMYYRRDGGIFIISQEDVLRVNDQKWRSLTLDVFPSSKAIITSRLMHERVTGAASNFTMATDGRGRLQLHLSLPLEVAHRRWVVRIHLRPGQSLKNAEVDGSAASDAIHLEPHESDPGVLGIFPFGGVRERPAPKAGPLVVVQLEGGARSRTLEAEIVPASDKFTVLYAMRRDESPYPVGWTVSSILAVLLVSVMAMVAILNSLRVRHGGRADDRLGGLAFEPL